MNVSQLFGVCFVYLLMCALATLNAHVALCGYLIAGNFHQVKILANLAQWYSAKFLANLFLHTSKFLREEFQPFVNTVSML